MRRVAVSYHADAAKFVLLNLMIDIAYALIDPRIGLSSTRLRPCDWQISTTLSGGLLPRSANFSASWRRKRN